MADGFAVDVDELHAMSKRLHGSGDIVNNQRNSVPPDPANAGASTSFLNATVMSFMTVASRQLDDISAVVGALEHSRDWYAEADNQARTDVLRPLRMPDPLIAPGGPLYHQGPQTP